MSQIDHKTHCEKCGEPWEEHDFGVPVPYCPKPPLPSPRTPEEIEIIRQLYRLKADFGRPTNAYVTITRPVTLKKWNGKHYPSVEVNTVTEEVPAGTTLKIVIVSRFGDCGLTDDLAAIYGYHARIDLDSPALSNIRWTHEQPTDDPPRGV